MVRGEASKRAHTRCHVLANTSAAATPINPKKGALSGHSGLDDMLFLRGKQGWLSGRSRVVLQKQAATRQAAREQQQDYRQNSTNKPLQEAQR
jgi:hypothetical protein